MKIELLKYDQLSEEDREGFSHHPYNCDTYLKVTHKGERILLETDVMEPEDATFGRDLNWIPEILDIAYKLGLVDGGTGC